MRSFIRSAFLFALAVSARAIPDDHSDKEKSAGIPGEIPSTIHSKKIIGKGPDGKINAHLARDLVTLQNFAKVVTRDNHTVEQWTGEDPCLFEGLDCDDNPDGYVSLAAIEFNDRRLGTQLSLDGFLDKLEDLAVFYARNNEFTGDIPHLHNLKELMDIDLSGNKFSGPFPEAVFEANLQLLDLSNNNFSGELPPKLFTETSYYTLILANNAFSGPLPDFGSSGIEKIDLSGNNFTGQIPASIGKLDGLIVIYLNDNQLTGPIPDEACAGKDLIYFDVRGNNLDTKNLGPNCKLALQQKRLYI